MYANMYTNTSIYMFHKRVLVKAAVLLLPLLGLTWLFGLLAVNEDTVVFAWIFTILNSLQVWSQFWLFA